LFKNQFGFKKGLGTIDTLYNVLKCIYNALDDTDDSQIAIVVFLDFANAFDTVEVLTINNY